MEILISGASGLIGSKLSPALTSAGHHVRHLVRSKAKASAADVVWDPKADVLDSVALRGIEAFIHLAGENIAGRWTAAKKAAIRDSRVRGTRILAEAISRMDRPPKVLICASAIGYYGDRGDEALTESSAPGAGFLPEVCKEWEAAAKPAADKGIRTVSLRFGVVLSPEGGALKKMLFPFKMGGGGVMGSGKQYWSWVDIDDVVGAAMYALSNDKLSGPVNVVSPNPATNREFTKALGKALSRPTIVPMPAFAARLAFGEMGDALLLASANVKPAKLQESGYAFKFPELEPALRHLLTA
jgi:uncharacterized protein (TIGR01777 family)